MSKVHVICPQSVMRLGELVAIEGNELLHSLTDEVECGRLVFPTSVKKECLKYDSGAESSTWIKAVSGSVETSEVPYNHGDWVLDECYEVLDETVTEWQANVDVLAMAHYYITAGRDVTVITNDLIAPPTRTCLADACDRLQFSHIDLESYLAAWREIDYDAASGMS